MRLLHTTDLELYEFTDTNNIPPYAILSHTWTDNEVTLQDVRNTSDRSGDSFAKIRNCCELARSHELQYAWIDTCCIDKTSSAELSEAINSMFGWYQRSQICFVFLSDVTMPERAKAEDQQSYLSGCRWFTRGWCLQELLSPSEVILYDARLYRIGSATELATTISAITSIGKEYLLKERSIYDASIAKRMSWASRRNTSRLEDTAYCLLGIFDVNMPLLYGEGRKAFLRLQQQIISQSSDESIFAWMADSGNRIRGIFAQWPSEFKHSIDVAPNNAGPKRPPYTVTNRGLQLSIPTPPWRNWLTISMPGALGFVELWLDCARYESDGQPGREVGIRICASNSPYATMNGVDEMNTNAGFVEWYRIDPTRLVLRKPKFMHHAENFLFGSYHPIYAVQSTPSKEQWHPKPINPTKRVASMLQSKEPAFAYKASRNHYQILEAVCVSLALMYIAFFPVRNVMPAYSEEAAWSWQYITYGFVFARSNFRFHAIVCFVLCLRPYLKEGVMREMANPMGIMGVAIGLEVVIDRCKVFFQRKDGPPPLVEGIVSK